MADSVTYVAVRRLKVHGEWREPGELVPEAAGWTTLSAYLDGYLKEVPVEAGSSLSPEWEARKAELDGHKKETIVNLAKKAKVPVYGSKKDIIERMLEAEFG